MVASKGKTTAKPGNGFNASRHRSVVRAISILRGSVYEAEWLFQHGCCYELFRILKDRWPEAELWYVDNPGHVYTKIGERFYDIRGWRRKPKRVRFVSARHLGRPDKWKTKAYRVLDAICTELAQQPQFTRVALKTVSLRNLIAIKKIVDGNLKLRTRK